MTRTAIAIDQRPKLGLFSLAVLLSAAACQRDSELTESEPVIGALVTSASVLTQHNDVNRTGVFSGETSLTPGNVRTSAGFRKVGQLDVDGQVYAQPLYAAGVTVNGSPRNVVYVATMHNSLFAFDAGTLAPLWRTSLGPSYPIFTPLGCAPTPVPPYPPPASPACAMTSPGIGRAFPPYHDVKDEIGVFSTPVIDPATNRLYVVSYSSTNRIGAAGDPRAYLSAGGVQHLVFRGADSNIHELFVGDEGWERPSLNNISALAGAPLAAGDPFGYTTFNGTVQHVVYRGQDNNIYELFAGSTWRFNRINTLAGAPAAAGDPAAYTTGDTQHVIYRGQDNVIHELFAGNTWQHNPISTLAGAPTAAGDPFGYVTGSDTQHAVYRGSDSRIYELFTSPRWTFNGISALAGGPLAAGNPKAYVTSDGTQHVIYRGQDSNVFELFAGSQWRLNSPNLAAGAPAATGDPFGYTTNGNIQHIVYRGTDSNVHELFAGAQWSQNTLNRTGIGTTILPAAQAAGNIAGFSTGGTNQHVAYRDINGLIQEAHAGNAWIGSAPTLSFSHVLHKVDLATGAIVASTPIAGSVSGSGDGSVGGNIAFDSKRQLQRAGLLLANGRIYVGFASYADTSPYHGWIFAFDAANLGRVGIFNTTPAAGGGGIWMAGQGLAADGNGSVYAMTGNSLGGKDTPAQGADLGESFLKLSSSLTLQDFFTPRTFAAMNASDADLGSAGPVLIPGEAKLFGGGKPGIIFELPTAQLGGFDSAGNVPGFQATFPSGGVSGHIHGSPVFFSGSDALGKRMYVWGESDQVRAYRYVNGRFERSAVLTTSLTPNQISQGDMPGGILSISANGGRNGVLWATHTRGPGGSTQGTNDPGVLWAFDANTLQMLWNSEALSTGADSLGNFGKFSPPTIAGGRVYVATFSGNVAVYGL